MYGILVWDCSSKNHLHKLQMLQYTCSRIIERYQFKQKLEPLFIKFEMLKIIQLQNLKIANILNSCLKAQYSANNFLSLLASPGKWLKMISLPLKKKCAQTSI